MKNTDTTTYRLPQKGELLEAIALLAFCGVITANEEERLQDKVETLF